MRTWLLWVSNERLKASSFFQRMFIRLRRFEMDRSPEGGQFPFDKHKHYLLVDMPLGGSWAGFIDQKDLPVEMEIDWVRFYEFKK